MTTDLSVVHTDRAHAVLSASGAKRWMHCPGSIRLTANLPNISTSDANKGTAAHEMANAALIAQLPASHFLGEKFNDIAIDEHMVESVQVYLDTCAEYMEPPWEYWVERQFSLEKLNPPVDMFGTADFVAIHRESRRLVGVDYKNGFLFVDAEGNDQLRYYALGALYSFDEMPQVEEVETVIVQPNSTGLPVKRATLHIAELIEWSMDLMACAQATQEPDAPLASGDWCKFCLASGRCPEQARKAGEAAQADFDDLVDPNPSTVIKLPEIRLLTPTEIGSIICRLDIFEDWAKAVREAGHSMLERGIDVPGAKLVAKRATESWKDESKVVEDLTDLSGIPEDKLYKPREPVSPAQARGALIEAIRGTKKITKKDAEAEARDLLAPLIDKKSSGTHVAPDNDSRPAVLSSALSDFDALPAPENSEQENLST